MSLFTIFTPIPHISHVITLSTKQKVIGIYAPSVTTDMSDNQSFRYMALKKLVSNSMRFTKFNFSVYRNTYSSIARNLCYTSHPFPAPIVRSLINFTEKSVNKIFYPFDVHSNTIPQMLGSVN